MVAKINRGASLYGAVIYNQQKVDDSTARIISGNRMIADVTGNPEQVMRNTLWAFENYLLANKNTEKPILHISLNPSVDDKLTDSQFADLAREYMQRMGYGDQPYIVYIHEDIDRRHIHIVSTCVNEKGEKIDDAYEWNRSMKACRELERKFGLKQVEDKRREMLEPYLKKADYQNGDVKQQVSNILKSVFSTYRFQSFGEYSALLSCFNIEAKQVRGEFEGTPYNGIVYTMTDDTGKPVCTPIKSSLIGKRFGYEGLEKRIGFNAREYKDKKWQPKIRNGVALAMHGCRGNREDFIRLLNRQGIDVVFRENNEGRIYGATFIDHKNREVYNGSRLGKEFSANAFERLFNGPNNIPDLDAPTPEISRQSSFSADMENAIVALRLQPGHGGVVSEGRVPDLQQAQALQGSQHDPHGGAVGENGHRLAVMLPGHPPQGREVAIQHLPGRLAAGDLPAIQPVVEIIVGLGVLPQQLIPTVLLPLPHADLSEGGIRMQLQPLGQIDGLGCGAGADQVAGVHGIHRHVPKALRQRPDLAAPPVIGDTAVIVSVGNAIEVALRLGVADKINRRHSFSFVGIRVTPP